MDEKTNIMEDEELKDKYCDRMCELCELHVYGQKMNTNQFNLCEGSNCDLALEYLKEELDEEEYEEKIHRRRYLLITI